MKQFHYHEIRNLQEHFFLSNFDILGLKIPMYILMITLCIGILSLIIGVVILITGKDEDLVIEIVEYLFIGGISMIIGSVFIFGSIWFVFILGYKTIGYYESELTVKKVEEINKIGEQKKYQFTMKEAKNSKGKLITIVSKSRQGLSKGDKAIVKTPPLYFKGGEEKNIDSKELLNFERNKKFLKGSKFVRTGLNGDVIEEEDLIIHKK